MDPLAKRVVKMIKAKLHVPDVWEGDDEPDVHGYRPMNEPVRQAQGTMAEVDHVITDQAFKQAGGDEIIEGGDTVLGIRGDRRSRSSWAVGKDRRRS